MSWDVKLDIASLPAADRHSRWAGGGTSHSEREFLSCFGEEMPGTFVEEARLIFRRADADASGTVDLEEFVNEICEVWREKFAQALERHLREEGGRSSWNAEDLLPRGSL